MARPGRGGHHGGHDGAPSRRKGDSGGEKDGSGRKSSSRQAPGAKAISRAAQISFKPGKGAKGRGGAAPAKRKRKRESIKDNPYQRVKLRSGVKRKVYANSQKAGNGVDFVDPNTGKRIPAQRDKKGNPIWIDPDSGKRVPAGTPGATTVPEKGKFHFGHKPGHEWWRYKEEAQRGGYSRERVVEDQNDPDIYQIEHPDDNVSHRHELPR